jgi:hypothetical protein
MFSEAKESAMAGKEGCSSRCQSQFVPAKFHAQRMNSIDDVNKLRMDEDELHNYLRQFSDRRWHPKYHLDVDTIKRSSAIWLRDGQEAHQLCALAHLTGLCEHLTLSFFSDKETLKTLFTSGTRAQQRIANKDVEKWLEEIRARGKEVLPTRTPRTSLYVSPHTADTYPKPNEAYRETALLVQRLMAQKSPDEIGGKIARSEELQKLKNNLRGEFQKAFGFSDDDLKRTARFYWRLFNSKLKPNSIDFDHKDFFQHGQNLVMVFQPYGLDYQDLSRWCHSVGASFVVAKEWAYYYPGHATLFFIEFTPQAKAELDRRLRKS